MDGPTLSNAEGISMLAIALFADIALPLFLLITLGVGVVITWPLNLIITTLLISWMWVRGKDRGRRGRLGKFARRRGIFAAIEVVPFVGTGFMPLQTLNTVFFLRKNSSNRV